MTQHTTQDQVEAIFPSHFFFFKDKDSEPMKFTKEGVMDVLEYLDLDYKEEDIEFKINQEENNYQCFIWMVGDTVIGYSNIIPYQEDVAYEVNSVDGNKENRTAYTTLTFQAEIPTQYIAAVASNPHHLDLWSVNGRPRGYIRKVEEDSIYLVTEFDKIEEGFYLPKMDTVQQLTDQEYIDFIAKIPFEDGDVSQNVQIIRTTMQELRSWDYTCFTGVFDA